MELVVGVGDPGPPKRGYPRAAGITDPGYILACPAWETLEKLLL